MNTKEFLLKMVEILKKEVPTEDAGERFEIDPDNINLEYEFPKRNGSKQKHYVYIHNGAYDNIFRIRVLEKQTTNANTETIADYMIALDDKDKEKFLLEFTDLINRVYLLKYPRSPEDVLAAVCPDILDDQLLGLSTGE